MILERNDCCDCSVDEYPCIGESCQQIHKQYHICDICGISTDDEQLYIYEGQDLCMNCIVEILESDLPRIFDI